LYYLLPKTQKVIQGSVQNEYLSLGDSKGLQRILASAFGGAKVELRDALLNELCTIDLLIIDEFALEPMTRDESRDL